MPHCGNLVRKGKSLATMDVKEKLQGITFYSKVPSTKINNVLEFILINLDKNLEREIHLETCVYGDLTRMHILISHIM